MNFGEVPFNEMAVIGGTKKMRGFFERLFLILCFATFNASSAKDSFSKS